MERVCLVDDAPIIPYRRVDGYVVTMPVTRFAPSPTGYLHLGHAFSALFARRAAGEQGTMRLRLEDIDQGRCRDAFAAAIFEDLTWLGLSWPEPVRVQSRHFADYAGALDRLAAMQLLYPCFCTRTRIAANIGQVLSAPHGTTSVYPGTCRRLAPERRAERLVEGIPFAWRLDVARASAATGPLTWRDLSRGEIAADPASLGDVVIARKDTPTSYHLSVTWDDAVEGVEIVTRGEDLLAATHIHRLLQALLGLPVPVWHHHPLIHDGAGERLAKRRGSPALRDYRAQGVSAGEIRTRLGFGDQAAL
jgi:glutamyl-Q tRNA(Asp) synthetase